MSARRIWCTTQNGFNIPRSGNDATDAAVLRVLDAQARLREACLDAIQAVADQLAATDERYPRLMLKYRNPLGEFERAWAVKANGHERILQEFAGDLADLLDNPALELETCLHKIPADRAEVIEDRSGAVTKVYFTARP